jgi:hypothetical protein
LNKIMSNQLATTAQTKNPYALALMAKKLNDMPLKEAKMHIADILSRAYFEIGLSDDKVPSDADQKLMIEAMYEEIKTVFPNCTVDELKLCMRNGVRREYGDYYGLNIATFNQWLKAFAQSERRRRAKLESEQRAETPPVSKEEALQMWKEVMVKYFNEYKTTGNLCAPLPTMQYRMYEEMGLINLTVNEKNELMEQAKINVLAKTRQQKAHNYMNGRIYDARALKNIITKLENNQPGSYEQNLIKSEARYLAIKKYYDGIEKLVFCRLMTCEQKTGIPDI